MKKTPALHPPQATGPYYRPPPFTAPRTPPIWTNNALTGINPYNLYNGGSVRASQRSQTFLAISFLLSQPDEAA